MATSETSETAPDVLARWLAITGLLAAAQDMLARRSGAWAAIALATIDAAVEAILGLVAASGEAAIDNRGSFERIMEQANDALRLTGAEVPSGLRQRLLSGHRTRNLALHEGVEPNVQLVHRAAAAAHELRDLATSRSAVLAAFRGTGPIRAVATLVDVAKISEELVGAADELEASSPVEACDRAAVALERALARVSPPLRDRRKKVRLPIGAARGYRSDTANIEILDDRTDRLEAWVLAIGVGLPPAELALLRRTLGTPRWYGNSERPTIWRHEEVVISPAVAEDAVLRVTDVIFRLWQSGSLVNDP